MTMPLPAGAAVRLAREADEWHRTPPSHCTAGPCGDDLRKWKATLTGPEGSPYEGGVFYLDITFPQDYPFKPPNVVFTTRIFHCNVSGRGEICLDVLKDRWSPVLTLSKVLLSICSLMDDPNPSDPLSMEAADAFKANRAGYDATAREWTQAYAAGGPEPYDSDDDDLPDLEYVDPRHPGVRV